ncbi:UvrD-helicase domain-containing protein, partial [Hafnia paralvei]|uniref:UvrD-helicase domain-containing protein n=1 Tax=Hafnia paralvei TaxID=546367 RepID=UPI003CD0D46A
CPGSGKTEVVAAKLAKEIYIWNKRPGGIAVLSFANSATEELICSSVNWLSIIFHRQLLMMSPTKLHPLYKQEQ